MVQLMIAIFGGLAIYLVGRKDKYKKYGYISGLLSQPFWLYTSFVNKQWGIMVLSLWYTYSWANGIKNYWFKQ